MYLYNNFEHCLALPIAPLRLKVSSIMITKFKRLLQAGFRPLVPGSMLAIIKARLQVLGLIVGVVLALTLLLVFIVAA
jgi:hypothetical protein